MQLDLARLRTSDAGLAPAPQVASDPRMGEIPGADPALMPLLEKGREYERLLEHLSTGLVVHASDSSIVLGNSMASSLLGLTKGEMLGKTLSDPTWRFLRDDGVPLPFAEYPVRRVLASGEAIRSQILGIRRPDMPAPIWVLCNAYPEHDAAGQIAQIIVSFIDITEHRRAEEALRESEETMRFIVKHDPNALAIFDRGMNYIAVSDRFLEDYDVSTDLIGKNHYEVFPEIPQVWRDVHQRCLAGAVESKEDDRFERPDGSVTYNRWECRPWYRAGGDIGGIIMYTEVTTARKMAEESLKDLNRHLEEETARAGQLAVEAQAATRAKGEFLALMSHELRTPLNGVLGFTELLTGTTALDEDQKSYAEAISKSGTHLLSIVNDILDFSSIEKGAMAILVAPLVLRELLESCAETVRKTAADKGLLFRSAIEPGVPEKILGDAQRIRQILINLLGNAVKFTATGSVILRVAAATEGGRPALDFSVEDTGIGMSPETIAILFQPFTQANMQLNRAFGGTGLGLAISKRLAEAMGGSISGQALPDKGSIFTLRLPLEVPSGSAP
jgi:PAS domain S-box-containing protein